MSTSKRIDLNRTVYELAQEYPELIDIMAGLGFSEITKPEALQSVGKIMTIPRGARVKDIPMMNVVSALTQHGFEIEGGMPDIEVPDQGAAQAQEQTQPGADQDSGQARIEQLKGLLQRLNQGEDLESVRKDFSRDFAQVDPSEIMKAEQELLGEGAPLSEVQRLCDVHSALFHGAAGIEPDQADAVSTDAGQASSGSGAAGGQTGGAAGTDAAEKPASGAVESQAGGAAGTDPVGAAVNPDDPSARQAYAGKDEAAAALEAIPGHPLRTLTQENQALSSFLEAYQKTKDPDILLKIRDLPVHYKKKGDLLYPVLKVRYGIAGPSQVMWTVDDEIRDEISALSRASSRDETWTKRLEAVLQRAQEMIFKEQNILFPICAVNFTEDEWKGIYRDSKDYDACLGVEKEVWPEAEAVDSGRPGAQTKPGAADGSSGGETGSDARLTSDEVVLPGGHMTLEQLRAVLNTIPMEITFVDADNINRFFNEGPKVFKRPSMALDREVFSCHPPKVEPMVRSIIEDFRSGKRDSVPVWMEKGGRSVLVNYMAVRDASGKYVGTLELVQDMEFAKKHFCR